jgi:hypothetical protein
MFKDCDVNNDGKISYSEFVQWFKKKILNASDCFGNANRMMEANVNEMKKNTKKKNDNIISMAAARNELEQIESLEVCGYTSMRHLALMCCCSQTLFRKRRADICETLEANKQEAAVLRVHYDKVVKMCHNLGSTIKGECKLGCGIWYLLLICRIILQVEHPKPSTFSIYTQELSEGVPVRGPVPRGFLQ